jgi:DeoR family fructose operon transcriptional repressor
MHVEVDRMYAEERQQAMAHLISRRGRLSVVQLAEQFEVTTETVRRDLSTLDRMGLVRRVHGGAVPAGSLTVIESGIGERDQSNTQAKEAIANAAVSLLPPPDSVIVIDAGSTTARFAAALPRDHRLTVITHAVPVATRLAGLPQIELHLLPGKVRPTTHAAVGAETVAALADLRADVAFLATNGLTVGHGLTTPDSDEAASKRAMIACARKTVVLADSTKLGVETAVRFATLDSLDVLVTDSDIEPSDRRALESAGIEVVVA